MIRFQSLGCVAFVIAITGCASRSEEASLVPPPAPTGQQTISVQISNAFPRQATFRITATSADGSSTVTLAESLRVPKPGPFRPEIDEASKAVGYAHAVVDPRPWTVSIRELESGSTVTCGMTPEGPRWVIAALGPAIAAAFLDSSPRLPG